MTTLTFHSDPGHGWLEVTSNQLEQAELTPDDFSACSYRDRKRAGVYYLEEDCDAPKFLNAYEAKFGRVTMRDITHGNDCYIRRMPAIK